MTSIFIVYRVKDKGKFRTMYNIRNTLESALSCALMAIQANDGFNYIVYEYVYADYEKLKYREHSLVGHEISDWGYVKSAYTGD